MARRPRSAGRHHKSRGCDPALIESGRISPGIGGGPPKVKAKLIADRDRDRQHGRVKAILAIADHITVRIPLGVSSEDDGARGVLGTFRPSTQAAVARRMARHPNYPKLMAELEGKIDAKPRDPVDSPETA